MELSAIKEKNDIAKELAIYNALHSVFIDKAFSSITINKTLNENRCAAAYITKLFYGVLDKSIQFDYIIRQFTKKRPQTSILIILKMGLYMMRYMDIPNYAAIDKMVNLCKLLGKKGISGFVNAVLRKSVDYQLPNKTEMDYITYLSVNYSYPKWAIEKLINQYDKIFAEEFLSADICQLTHIRANLTKISSEEFDSEIEAKGYEKKTEFGYYVTRNQLQKLKKSDYIIQSLSSVIAIYSLLSNIVINSALDLCSAPGGKAVLIRQLTGAAVTACDIFPHRAQLIEKYVSDVGISDIRILVNDANDLTLEWIGFFDFVLCDVPCSNFGVIASKPDIVLNKSAEDSLKLKKMQYSILDNAARYVKNGGYLAYSTCTIFKDENEEIIEQFLKNHREFELDKIDNSYSDNNGMIKIIPQKFNTGAFFAVRMRRI